MSESNTHIDLFTSSGCLSTESLKMYSSDKLASKQKLEVDAHLESCELCSDALEGMQLLSDPQKLNRIVLEINENFKNKLLQKQSKKNTVHNRLYYIAAAASVLILIGVFSYFKYYWQNQNSEIATLNKKSFSEQTETINESVEHKSAKVFLEDDIEEIKPAAPVKFINEDIEAQAEESDIIAVEEVEAEIEIVMDEAYPADKQKGIIEETMEEVMIAEPVSIAVNEEPTQYLVSEEAVRADGMAAGQVVSYEDQSDSEIEISSKSSSAAKKGRQKTSAEISRNNIINPEFLSDSTVTVFSVVENLPEFPGGMEALFKHIQEKISYPDSARLLGIQGTVYVSFVVKKSGTVDNAYILRGIGGGCDEEALKVVKSMPDWIPGEQKGKPVNVQMALPIKFKLEK